MLKLFIAIIVLYLILLILECGFNYIVRYKVNSYMFKLVLKINNDLVKKYIEYLTYLNIKDNKKEHMELKNYFNMINDEENVDLELKKHLRRVLLSKGVNLGNVNIKMSFAERKKLEAESRQRSGNKGEENVQYKLKWLGLEYKSLHNVNLPHQIEKQELDSIVVGPNGVFHIETKNYGGVNGCSIFIKENGDWMRQDNDKIVGVENPSFQVARHDRVLQDYIKFKFPDKNIPVVGIIVLSNEKTMINGSENSKVPVIKADRLVDFIENYDLDKTLAPEEIENIYSSLKLYE